MTLTLIKNSIFGLWFIDFIAWRYITPRHDVM